MLKKWHIGVALGAMVAIGFTASASADDVYIPLICKGFQHQFWQSVKAGAEEVAKANGVKMTFEGPETEAMVDKQIDMLSAALAKHPKAIGFAALDSKAAIPLLKKAQDDISTCTHETPSRGSSRGQDKPVYAVGTLIAERRRGRHSPRYKLPGRPAYSSAVNMVRSCVSLHYRYNNANKPEHGSPGWNERDLL